MLAGEKKFWRIVLWTGLLILVFSVLSMLVLFYTKTAEVKALRNMSSDIERDLAVMAARGGIFRSIAQISLPVALLGAVAVNIAKYNLRKIKKKVAAEKTGKANDLTY